MRRLLYILYVLAFSLAPACAQNSQGLLDNDAYYARHEYAKLLNDKERYMEAYDSLCLLHRDMQMSMKVHGMTAATLPANKDFIFYLNVLISEAECAYKVNLWREMQTVCDEMTDALKIRKGNELSTEEDYYWQLASLCKVKGDLYYVRGIEYNLYFFDAIDEYKNALKYYELADKKKSATFEIAQVYTELAQVEYAQTNYEEALNYLETALDLCNIRRSAGSNAKESQADERADSFLKTLQSAIAICQARNSSYRKALSAIDGLIARMPKGDKRIAEMKRKKAKILTMRHEPNDMKEASQLYAEYFAAVKKDVENNFMQMTADQREEYWMLQRPFVVDCYLLEGTNPELLYDVTLYNKGILLQTSHSFDELLHDGTKRGELNEKQHINILRQQDAHNALNGITSDFAGTYEKQLLQKMNADGRRNKFFASFNCTWKDVQRALPADGCAVEFIEYEKEDAMHFGALVLTKTGKPRFVHVCNADELADYYPGDWLFTLKALLKSTDGSSKNDIYEDEGIRDAIWNEQLIAAIGNSKKVYFSADGYLHQLAIEYMLPESLADKQLYRLTSTRLLACGNKVDAKKVKNGAALVLGGIIYDSFYDTHSQHEPGNDAIAFKKLQDRGSQFGYMPGAKTECDSIVFYRNNPSDKYLYGLDATEQEFYRNCSNYPILHISTHGCFSGDKMIYNELLATSSKDVLSESVLALSDAGTHLRDRKFNAFNKDGLLSAREVARLNLENVELVTTSACQTGLGYITADGIYGMQRGFKSAGAKGMVMTLWSVNVESARIFFTSMYRYIAEGESVHSAFTHARNDLLTKDYSTNVTSSKFNGSTLSHKEKNVINTKMYNKPQHSCPYLLIDVWE